MKSVPGTQSSSLTALTNSRDAASESGQSIAPAANLMLGLRGKSHQRRMLALLSVVTNFTVWVASTVSGIRSDRFDGDEFWLSFMVTGVLIMVPPFFLAIFQLHRHLTFKCHACGKHLTTKIPWACSYCDTVTPTPWGSFHSFLHRCPACKTAPKSVFCMHCQACIFLDKDCDARHPARRHIPAPAIVIVPDPQIVKRKERTEKKVSRMVADIQSTRDVLDTMSNVRRSVSKEILDRSDLSDEEKERELESLELALEDARVRHL
jgi:hypothetical protein